MTGSVFRKVMAVGVAVAAVTGLAGCATDPRTAAVVDDRVISQSDVAVIYDELESLLNSASPATVVTMLVEAPEIIDVAKANDIVVSEDDAITFLDEASQGIGREADSGWDNGSILIAQSDLSLRAISSLPEATAALAAIEKQVQALDVTINPQYGEWGTGGLGPVSYDWLAGAPAGVE
jgi:hypothetical protein